MPERSSGRKSRKRGDSPERGDAGSAPERSSGRKSRRRDDSAERADGGDRSTTRKPRRRDESPDASGGDSSHKYRRHVEEAESLTSDRKRSRKHDSYKGEADGSSRQDKEGSSNREKESSVSAQCTVEDGVVTCSVEETNRVRLALGLKPLNTEDKSITTRKYVDASTIEKEPPTAADVREAEEVEKRRRVREALASGPGLADIISQEERTLRTNQEDASSGDDDDDDNLDPVLWVARMRKNQSEKQLLASQDQNSRGPVRPGVKYGDEDDYDTQGGSERPSGSKSIKVAHDLSEIEAGTTEIFTLADQPLINKAGRLTGEGDADEEESLENPRLASIAISERNKLEKSKTSVYDPTEDEQIGPDGLPMKRDVLAHYDEWLGKNSVSSGSGRKGLSFQVSVDEDGRLSEMNASETSKAAWAKSVASNLETPKRPILDTYTHEELKAIKAAKFKGRKKKVVQKSVRQKNEIEEDENGMEGQKSSASPAEDDGASAATNGTASQQKQPAATSAAASTAASSTSSRSATVTMEEDPLDGEDLDDRLFFEQLNRQRRLNAIRQRREREAGMTDDGHRQQSANADAGAKMDDGPSIKIERPNELTKSEAEMDEPTVVVKAEPTYEDIDARAWNMKEMISSTKDVRSVDDVSLDVVRSGLESVVLPAMLSSSSSGKLGPGLTIQSSAIASASAAAAPEIAANEREAARRAELDRVKKELEDEEGRQTVSITATTEFCRTVPTPLEKLMAEAEQKSREADSRAASSSSSSSSSSSALKFSSRSSRRPHKTGTADTRENDVDVKSEVDDDSDSDLDGDAMVDNDSEPLGDENYKEMVDKLHEYGMIEPEIDDGLAGALKYLQAKGDITHIDDWRVGRHNRGNVPMFNDRDPNVYDGTRHVDKFLTTMKTSTDLRKELATSSSSSHGATASVGGGKAGPNKLDEEGGILFDYRDKYGRVLTQKEAFKHISWVFHGKGPGKRKQEKMLKRLYQEKKLRLMAEGGAHDEDGANSMPGGSVRQGALSTVLAVPPSLRALREKQKEGSMGLVLTGQDEGKRK